MRKNKEDMGSFIKKLKRFLVESKVFKSEKEVINFFSYGGCFILSILLKIKYPKAKIVINSDENHCAILYKKEIYDILGPIDGSEEYKVVDRLDLQYMYYNFGFEGYSHFQEFKFIFTVLRKINKKNPKIHISLPAFKFYKEENN